MAFRFLDSGTNRSNQLWICQFLLAGVIVLSTLAVPLGAKQIPLSFLFGIFLFVIVAIQTRGAFDPLRLVTFGLMVATIVCEAALFHTTFSQTSLLYIICVYGPLVLTLPALTQIEQRSVWRAFSNLAVFIGLCGLVQVVGQLFRHGLFIDPLRSIPAKFLLDGYNTTYPVTYGHWLLKPNGMFLLEPSFYSQVVALALLAEFLFFRRAFRIVFLMICLGASFSGTGFMILCAAMVFMGSARLIALFCGLSALVAGGLSLFGFGEFLAQRALETGEERSSGHMRFVAPYLEMIDVMERSTNSMLFGNGAGFSEKVSTGAEAQFSAMPKVALEYGLLGLVAFTALWWTLFNNCAPAPLLVGLSIFYFLGSGSLLQPFSVFLMWSLTAGLRYDTGKEPSQLKSPWPIFRLSQS